MTHNPLIIDAVRTARGKRKGRFATLHPADLATFPLNALATRNKLDPSLVEDVMLGCVTQTGEQGWCVARKAVLAAGWPISVPATTINRLCGSGQQAVNSVASAIAAGTYDIAVGGGVEHMTRCPMFSDIGGEESPMLVARFPDLVQQGVAAEILSETYKLSRESLDEYAARSQQRAAAAQKSGFFSKSIISVNVPGLGEVNADEAIRPETTPAGLAALKPVFKPDGVITAGNASAIVDGAAAILLASENAAKRLGLKPRGRIIASAVIGSPPKIMLTGPIAASKLALSKAGLSVNDIDVWEINEAFAPVPLVTIKELNLDPNKANVNGGGISLGHPLGATGAMLIGTALDELERTEKRYACITMCIGLGMGIATVIERI
jgi:acetyl-CoA acetyltransferase family protein